MNKRSNLLLLLTLSAFVTIFISACKDKAEPQKQNGPVVFEDIIFNSGKMYFVTDGSMAGPIGKDSAQLIADKIDLTFFYDEYKEPAFFDPIARSDTWSWEYFIDPWLSNSIQTTFYYSYLSQEDFNECKNNETQIGNLFDADSFYIAPHQIYPEGSCIGGRVTFTPKSVSLLKGSVFGFKNGNNKRGLIYISKDQVTGWPKSVSTTKVSIIRER